MINVLKAKHPPKKLNNKTSYKNPLHKKKIKFKYFEIKQTKIINLLITTDAFNVEDESAVSHGVRKLRDRKYRNQALKMHYDIIVEIAVSELLKISYSKIVYLENIVNEVRYCFF